MCLVSYNHSRRRTLFKACPAISKYRLQQVLYFRMGVANSFETWHSNAIRINFDKFIGLLFSDRKWMS